MTYVSFEEDTHVILFLVPLVPDSHEKVPREAGRNAQTRGSGLTTERPTEAETRRRRARGLHATPKTTKRGAEG